MKNRMKMTSEACDFAKKTSWNNRFINEFWKKLCSSQNRVCESRLTQVENIDCSEIIWEEDLESFFFSPFYDGITLEEDDLPAKLYLQSKNHPTWSGQAPPSPTIYSIVPPPPIIPSWLRDGQLKWRTSASPASCCWPHDEHPRASSSTSGGDRLSIWSSPLGPPPSPHFSLPSTGRLLSWRKCTMEFILIVSISKMWKHFITSFPIKKPYLGGGGRRLSFRKMKATEPGLSIRWFYEVNLDLHLG